MALGTKRIYIDPVGQAIIKVPAGASYNSTPSALGTPQIVEEKTYAIAASGIVNATKTTAFAAIITALTSAIDADIAAATGFGIDTTASDVDYNCKVKQIGRGSNPTDYLLTAATDAINVTVELSLYIAAA